MAQSRDFVNSSLVFIDRHPRLGWYIAAIVTANFLLQLLELLL